jgi:tripartite-type tricarboxylate transporter receptor subunit TctC
MTTRDAMRAMATVAALGVLLAPALAQRDSAGYPNKAVRIVVPASPGGVNDIVARLVGQKLTESLGQPVVIDNKPGAGTIIGAEYVARSQPDGYTLLVTAMATMAVLPAIKQKLSFTPKRDFVPVVLAATYPYLLAAGAAAPVKTVRELIDYTKANPDKSNAGGASVTFQLATEMFKQRTGARLQYVPFKGSNEATLALISGQMLASFVDAGPATPQIKGGKLRALAVTSPTRMPTFPDIPTLSEAGVSDMQIVSWVGLFAPAGTPSAIVKKLEAEVIRIVMLPEIQARLRQLELTPAGLHSREFAGIIDKDLATWSKVATAANIKIP